MFKYQVSILTHSFGKFFQEVEAVNSEDAEAVFRGMHPEFEGVPVHVFELPGSKP